MPSSDIFRGDESVYAPPPPPTLNDFIAPALDATTAVSILPDSPDDPTPAAAADFTPARAATIRKAEDALSPTREKTAQDARRERRRASFHETAVSAAAEPASTAAAAPAQKTVPAPAPDEAQATSTRPRAGTVAYQREAASAPSADTTAAKLRLEEGSKHRRAVDSSLQGDRFGYFMHPIVPQADKDTAGRDKSIASADEPLDPGRPGDRPDEVARATAQPVDKPNFEPGKSLASADMDISSSQPAGAAEKTEDADSDPDFFLDKGKEAQPDPGSPSASVIARQRNRQREQARRLQSWREITAIESRSDAARNLLSRSPPRMRRASTSQPRAATSAPHAFRAPNPVAAPLASQTQMPSQSQPATAPVPPARAPSHAPHASPVAPPPVPQPPAPAAHVHDVDMDDVDDLYDVPAAQPPRQDTEDDADSVNSEANVSIADLQSEPESVHELVPPVIEGFENATVFVSASGDNRVVDGIEVNELLEGLDPTMHKAWTAHKGSKALLAVGRSGDTRALEDQDPIVILAKTKADFNGAGIKANFVIAEWAPDAPPKKHPFIILVWNISNHDRHVLLSRRHWIFGTTNFTVFRFTMDPPEFIGTVRGSNQDADDLKLAADDEWVNDERVIALFERHYELNLDVEVPVLLDGLIQSIRIEPLTIIDKVDKVKTVEHNIYAYVGHLDLAMRNELRDILRSIPLRHELKNTAVWRVGDDAWFCGSCGSTSHPTGHCPTKKIAGWHRPWIQLAVAAGRGGRGGTSRGNGGNRGGTNRGGAGGRGGTNRGGAGGRGGAHAGRGNGAFMGRGGGAHAGRGGGVHANRGGGPHAGRGGGAHAGRGGGAHAGRGGGFNYRGNGARGGRGGGRGRGAAV